MEKLVTNGNYFQNIIKIKGDKFMGIPVAQLIKDFKHLALERKTYYDNHYPSNCGEINPDGSISFDCIGLWKSYINEPSIAYRTSPAGYFVRPGQVIPDTTEYGLLQLCSNIHWNDFSNCIPGSYMYMPGHAGSFMGEFEDYKMGGIVNTIECTVAWYGGVLTSYTDIYGNRFQYKGGPQCGRWEAWGQMTPYVDYSTPKPPQPYVPTKETVDDVVKDIIAGKYGNYPERQENLYRHIQDEVNKAYAAGVQGKVHDNYTTVFEVVEGVIAGAFGSGEERKVRIYRFFQDKIG